MPLYHTFLTALDLLIKTQTMLGQVKKEKGAKSIHVYIKIITRHSGLLIIRTTANVAGMSIDLGMT